MPFLFL